MTQYVSNFEVGGNIIYCKDDEARSDIANLQTQIASIATHDLRNRKFLCISDSYGTDSLPERYSWCSVFRDEVGLTNNVNYFKYSTPGAGFAWNGGMPGDTKNFCDVLNNAVVGLTNTQRESITDIIIGGGANDWTDNADTETGIDNFNTIARTNFPNAKIWLFCLGWAKRNDIRYGLCNVYPRYYKRGSNNKWVVVTSSISALQNKVRFVADGVHPTPQGSTVMAEMIINILMGGINISDQFDIDGITINGSQRGVAHLQGNMLKVNMNTFSPGALSNIGGSGSTQEIDLCEINSNLIFGSDIYAEYYPATLSMKINGTWQHKQVNVRFRYDSVNDKTYLTARNNAEIISSGGFGSYSGITDSYISIQSLMISPYC